MIRFGQIEIAVRKALSYESVPIELQDEILKATYGVTVNYMAQKNRPSELHAGDFVEACVRILEFLDKGSYTMLDKPIPRMDRFVENMQQSSLDETFRIHIPRQLRAIYTIRNRRGVGHLPGKISANRADAILLLTSIRWVLAEFIRVLDGSFDHLSAQNAVDLLAVTNVPVVEEFEGIERVITGKSVPLTNKVLILVHASIDGRKSVQEILESTRANIGHLRTTLKRLESRDLIHLGKEDNIALTRIGKNAAAELIQSLSYAD